MVQFNTPQYNGPLDLLLALIQKNEVNIYDIPISLITDQFLAYIRSSNDINLEDLSEFYKMAAELIWIKSQMLLPKDVEFSDEYSDPRDELVQRLLEYSKYKKYSELLLESEEDKLLAITRNEGEFILPVTDSELITDTSIQNLFMLFKELISNIGVNDKVFNIYEEVSEREKLALLNELLEKKDIVRFSELFQAKSSPMHIICAFLAVLVGVRDKLFTVCQSEIFSDIDIRKRTDVSYNDIADE